MFVELFGALILTVFQCVDFVGEFADFFFKFFQLLFVDVAQVVGQEERTIDFNSGTVSDFRIVGLFFI